MHRRHAGHTGAALGVLAVALVAGPPAGCRAASLEIALPELAGLYDPSQAPPGTAVSVYERQADPQLDELFSDVQSVEISIQGTGSAELLPQGVLGCPLAGGCAQESRLFAALGTQQDPFLWTVQLGDFDAGFDVSATFMPLFGSSLDFLTQPGATLRLQQDVYEYPLGPGEPIHLIRSAAFEIDAVTLTVHGTVVPEPGSLPLTAAGLGMLAVRRRTARRRR